MCVWKSHTSHIVDHNYSLKTFKLHTVYVMLTDGVVTCRDDFYCYGLRRDATCVGGYCRCPNVPHVDECTCLGE